MSRGGARCRIAMLAENSVVATLVDDRMTRSILLQADDASATLVATRWIGDRFDELRREVAAGSRHVEPIDMATPDRRESASLASSSIPATPPAII